MAEVIQSPAVDVFTRWRKPIEAAIGKGNCSMEQSKTVAKTPFARLLFLGGPQYSTDLSGNENATNISFQVECFTSGSGALTQVYNIDSVSHEAMVSMGFRRTYGPELIENIDSAIKRTVSRYSRVYSGELLDDKE